MVVNDAARPHITIGINTGADGPEAGGHPTGLLAGQLYETLVRVDCTDRVIAGLAHSWSSADGSHWRFELRRGASFTDGTPVNARTAAAALSTVPLLAAVTVMGEYDLRLTLGSPADVRLFAARTFMVTRTAGTDPPAGTGPYSVSSQPGGSVQLIARGTDAEGAVAPDTIGVRAFGEDLRRAIDAGVDALVTRDAATLAYARARTGYNVAPLTWSTTYVLATAAAADSVSDVPATAFPAALVGAASRPAL